MVNADTSIQLFSASPIQSPLLDYLTISLIEGLKWIPDLLSETCMTFKVFLTGLPGHGKTSLACSIIDKLKSLGLTTRLVLAGSLIAQEIRQKTYLGIKAAPYFDSHKGAVPN